MPTTLEAILICVEEEEEMMHVLADDSVNECASGGPNCKHIGAVMRGMMGG